MASNKRERELARMRAERQAARRAAAEAARRQRRRNLLTALAAVLVVAVGAVVFLVTRGDDKEKDTLSTSPTPLPTTTSGTGTGTCTYTSGGRSAKKFEGAPITQGVRTTGTQKVTFTLTQGVVQADLFTSKAPCTVNSFTFLAQQKYFDDTPCPRIVTFGIFVLQCGDPSGTTGGGPGYTFADENLAGATYPAGTLAMANSGPNTNGSQFFMVYKDSTTLPPNYTPFGKITKGLDVLEKIAKAGDDGSNPAGGGKPKQPVNLVKVVVTG